MIYLIPVNPFQNFPQTGNPIELIPALQTEKMILDSGNGLSKNNLIMFTIFRRF